VHERFYGGAQFAIPRNRRCLQQSCLRHVERADLPLARRRTTLPNSRSLIACKRGLCGLAISLPEHFWHGALASRVSRPIGNRLGSACEALSEAGITLPWSDTSFYVADVAVTCSPLAGQSWCPDPIVIVEVLSPSTEGYDRGKKFAAYRTIASLQAYVLISQDDYRIEHFARQANGLWVLSDATGADATLQLPTINCALALADVYRETELAEQASADLTGP